jgi:hypothetical protein
MPIVAVVLMLTSHRARVNGPVFVLGWLIGLGIVGVIVLALSGASGASHSGSAATGEGWVKIVLGVLLLMVALRLFRHRTPGESRTPKWLTTIDKITPVAAVGLGAGLSCLNPKNLVLAVGGAAAIAQTGISGGQQAVAYVVFALVGTLGVGIPLIIYFSMGARSEKILGGLKDWMNTHNDVIMIVLCVIIAAKLIGDGITGLTN